MYQKNELFGNYISVGPHNKATAEIEIISIIRSSDEYIHIIDPYFNKEYLRILIKAFKSIDTMEEDDFLDAYQIDEISIITRLSGNLSDNFHKKARQLKQILDKRNIQLSIRILIDFNIHDRYLYSKTKKYNFCPIDSIKRGKWAYVSQLPSYIISPAFSPLFENSHCFFNNSIAIIDRAKELSEASSTRDTAINKLPKIKLCS
jgi:hypothetical protein